MKTVINSNSFRNNNLNAFCQLKKRGVIMNKLVFLLACLLSIFLLNSCEKDSSPQEQTLEVDAVMTEQSTFGWELNDLVKSGDDISGLTQSSEFLGQGNDEFPGMEKMKQQAIQMSREAGSILSARPFLAKTLTDSLIYFEEDTLHGTRAAMYYDAETGVATYYLVKYKFMALRPLVYDSAVVVVDMNFTFENSADDLIKVLYQQRLFRETFFIQKIVGEVTVTDYNGTEISGLEASQDTHYRQDRFLQQLTQTVDLNPDQSGTVREDFKFRDNKTAYREITFYVNHTGEFSKQLRDGTMVTGTFNCVEDDLQGWYNELIDFPPGRYLDKIMKSAEVAIDTLYNTFTAQFVEHIFFSSGKIDTIAIALASYQDGEMRHTGLEIQRANGAHGSFTLMQTGDEGTLTGTWTTWNDYYIIIEAEYYADGSAHVYYEVYAPPYTEGDDPILIADYDITPDGSGTGTITYNGEVYQVTFDGITQAEITKGGKKATVNLFK
jgi:hypothetical protein